MSGNWALKTLGHLGIQSTQALRYSGTWERSNLDTRTVKACGFPATWALKELYLSESQQTIHKFIHTSRLT